MNTILVLILFLAPIVAIAVGGFIIYNKAKASLTRIFGTTSISEFADIRDMEIEQTPKSISGMESLERPKIENDFPDMSIDELKSRDIDEIYAYYHALETGDFSRYKDNELFNDMMNSAINEAKKKNFSLTGIKIHRQSISRYAKTADTASIKLQTAFEGTKKDNRNTAGKRTQLKVETEWVYLLSDSNFGRSLTATLNCPNCNAPISNIGDNVCEHCGSDIKIDYSRSWQLSYIVEC